MATVWTEYTPNGERLPVTICDFSLTAAADGTDTDTTDFPVGGEVVRVELYTADTVADTATIKGYEASARPAVGSRQDFLAYVKAGAGTLSAEILPVVQRTDKAGTAVANEYAPPIVFGDLTVAIAGFTASTSIQVRVYVKG